MSRLVSVVVPAHNAEGYIVRAMTSVLSQSHGELELIVVDDGSTDDTHTNASEIDDPRVRLLSQSNKGAAAARNLGLSEATGSFIAFLDADDYWFAEKLEKQLMVMDDQPNCAAVGSLMQYESMSGRRLGIAGEMVGPEDQDRVAQARFMPFRFSSLLFRATHLRDCGGFDESLEVSEDFDLVVRLAAHGEILGVPEILGAYVIHDESITAKQFEQQRMVTRFIRARLVASASGEVLHWQEFKRTYRPSLRQRHGDWVQARYRAAGQSAAAGRWGHAVRYGASALLAGPRYTISRLYRQQLGRAR